MSLNLGEIELIHNLIKSCKGLGPSARKTSFDFYYKRHSKDLMPHDYDSPEVKAAKEDAMMDLQALEPQTTKYGTYVGGGRKKRRRTKKGRKSKNKTSKKKRTRKVNRRR
jgi:hypothetical protein